MKASTDTTAPGSAADPNGGEAVFAAALLSPELPPPPGLRAWNGSDPAARFAVYRNNVVSSLVAALEDTFPVVRELVGAPFFAAGARHFISAHPPRGPVLSAYGADFGRFLDAYAPAAPLPYLGDVARLEFARVQAFHAADAQALSPAAFAAGMAQAEADGTLAATRWQLHPAVQVLASHHAVVSLWAAHQGHGDLACVDPAVPQAALVLRADDDAAVIGIGHAAAVFIQALLDGVPLGLAAERAAITPAADGIAFDAAATIGLLIAHHTLTAWLARAD